MYYIVYRYSVLTNLKPLVLSDERSIILEKQRLRLRRAIQPSQSGSIATGRSMDFNQFVNTPSNNVQQMQIQPQFNSFDSAQPSYRKFLQKNQVRSIFHDNQTSFATRPNTSTRNQSATSPGSRKSTSKAAPIYAWETEATNKTGQDHMIMDDAYYAASNIIGLYTRMPLNDQEDELINASTEANNLYVDFQIVLSKEEIITLAARKKSYREDNVIDKNIAAGASANVSTPYVEPKRVLIFRPTEQDKWIDQRGLITTKKFRNHRL